ncbi:LysR family transcriptional regulator [Shimia sp.]|uniref:LysR family transcriptional regulator n=1 Tax=Shimia sp. TaxID=1954381 RepID=UPI003B8D2623
MRANHHRFVAFAHVVREGSFSAAAICLGVTQSAVTQHVAKLEKQVGSQLLLRSRDGVTLTRTGRELYDLADRMVTLDATITERLKGFEAMERGHIRIIANAPLPALRAVSQFRQTYPEVEIEFALYDWTTATQLLRERRADVGLITDPPDVDDWERLTIQKSRYVAYVLPSSPLANRKHLHFSELAKETIILPENGSLTERVVRETQAAYGIQFRRSIKMTTFPLMCEAVLQGAGIAIFLSNSGLISRGLVEIPVAELSQEHETAVVAPKDRARLRLAKAFIEIAASSGFR